MSPSIPYPSDLPDDLRELWDVVETAPAARSTPPPTEETQFQEAFTAWAEACELKPGRVNGAIAEDLYRHFTAWCDEQSKSVLQPSPKMWGGALRALGLVRGRQMLQGRDTRPYMMAEGTARFFRAWLKDHPTPPVGTHILNRRFPPKVKSKGTP
jgi:hypothetical protein